MFPTVSYKYFKSKSKHYNLHFMLFVVPFLGGVA